jgi:Txe/YoeB family toxin of Txe-Axe toxin-antitoxin module
MKLTGKETPLELSQAFRKHWERRAKRNRRIMWRVLDALVDGNQEKALELLEDELYG